MTDWVDNHIRIEGHEGALAGCVEHCFPGRQGLACDHVLPIPEVTRGVTSGRTDAVGSDGAIGVEILTGQP